MHFAIVQEHDGTTAGIVTLDDLLEELVGDIVDEMTSDDARPGRPDAEGPWT